MCKQIITQLRLYKRLNFCKIDKKYPDVLILLKSIKAVSSLEKIFIDSDVSDLTELKHFSMLKNEKSLFK